MLDSGTKFVHTSSASAVSSDLRSAAHKSRILVPLEQRLHCGGLPTGISHIAPQILDVLYCDVW